jgi:hypothetical protein
MQVDKVIQISSTVFKETVEIILITKYEVFQIRHRFQVTAFLLWCRFYYREGRFLQQ